MPRAFVVSEVRTFIKVVAVFAGALLALGLWASQASTQPATDPELSITKAGPATVEPGQRFNYVLTVTNAENAGDATLVQVTDRLPEGVDFLNSDPDICSATQDPMDASRERVTCQIPTLAAGASRRIELTVTAPSDVGDIENRATVESTGTDPENSNEVTTEVLPRLEIVKQDDPDRAGTEDLILYTLRVQNEGNTTVEGVAVTDDLPLDQVDFVALDSRDFRCEYTAGLV